RLRTRGPRLPATRWKVDRRVLAREAVRPAKPPQSTREVAWSSHGNRRSSSWNSGPREVMCRSDVFARAGAGGSAASDLELVVLTTMPRLSSLDVCRTPFQAADGSACGTCRIRADRARETRPNFH